MQRDFSSLKDGPFDLLIIGGGIYGSWAAYDAALKGFRVALIEKGDWASGTSSASSKLIHGGLRYLEHFEFNLVRHALQERRTLTRIAPHQIDPVRFLIPMYKGARVGKTKMRLGLGLYDRLAGNDQPVKRHQSHSMEEVLADHPYLTKDGLRGGLSYGDCQEDDARMTLEVVATAMAAGAKAVNYAKAERLRTDKGRVTGATVVDEFSGESIDVTAKVVVNATGPWASGLLGDEVRKVSTQLIKGIHLVMPQLPGKREAMLLTAKSDGRVFFIIPWYEHTLIGTTESEHIGKPSEARVLPEEADYLLEETRHALGGVDWQREDICGCYVGVRTLISEEEESLSAVTREFSIENPAPGLYMPLGGKFTTARRDSSLIVKRAIEEELGDPKEKTQTASQPLAWVPEGDFDDWLQASIKQGELLGLDSVTAYWCAKRHGRRVTYLFDLLEVDATLAERLSPDSPFCRAEIKFAAGMEMAQTLDDLLRRRLPISLLTRPNDELLETAASLAAPILGWNQDRIEQEKKRALAQWRTPDGQ